MHNVRIIAGKFGGRILDTPKTRRTHPMGERIRNAIFNTLTDRLDGANILDVFAGTGALGIEAISRGAERATLIERDRIAQKAIYNNIELLGIDDKAKLIRSNVSGWLSTSTEYGFDIIFVDPPYYDIKKHETTVSRLLTRLSSGGLLLLSKPGRDKLEIECPPYVDFIGKRNYSDAEILFYQRK